MKMLMLMHKQELLQSVSAADEVLWYQGDGVQWLTKEFLDNDQSGEGSRLIAAKHSLHPSNYFPYTWPGWA